jgi:hypothetical protein
LPISVGGRYSVFGRLSAVPVDGRRSSNKRGLSIS